MDPEVDNAEGEQIETNVIEEPKETATTGQSATDTEPEEYVPTFLDEDEPPAPMYPPQMGYMPPPQYPQYPQYPPQPQPQPQRRRKIDINALVEDPEEAFTELAESKMGEIVGRAMMPLMQQQMAMARIAQEQTMAYANEALGRARNSISTAYKEVFSKDTAYRSSKAVRDRIDSFIKQNMQEAKIAARTGNIGRLNATMSMLTDPNFARGALLLASLEAGYQPNKGPVKMTGFKSESSRPSPKRESPEGDPSVEAVLERRFGSGYVEKYRKARAEYGDFD